MGDQQDIGSLAAIGGQGVIQEIMQAFWQQQMNEIENGPLDWKFHQLPLARIKKVMKSDDEVKMISAEAPLMFSKACEIFILELTMRAWIHTEENKRRTLQKSDVAQAVSKADMYDFLIDIVPRDEFLMNRPAGSSSTPAYKPAGSAEPFPFSASQFIQTYLNPAPGAPGDIYTSGIRPGEPGPSSGAPSSADPSQPSPQGHGHHHIPGAPSGGPPSAGPM
ncbi:hypothetical protein HDU96_006258 [Phlyctochytrium bullatum]|nr:hypothetical protein HDU96_006258 [Phlyctochytrium bullatum]